MHRRHPRGPSQPTGMPGSLWDSFRAIAASFFYFLVTSMCKVSCFRWDGVRSNLSDVKLSSWSKKSPTSLSPLRIKQRLTSYPGSFCPSPIPPTPGQPCNLPGTLDCSYGLTGNCCCGQCDVDMTCAPDSTNGSGLWQPKHSMLCPTEGCGSEGEWWTENVKEVDPFLKYKLINC